MIKEGGTLNFLPLLMVISAVILFLVFGFALNSWAASRSQENSKDELASDPIVPSGEHLFSLKYFLLGAVYFCIQCLVLLLIWWSFDFANDRPSGVTPYYAAAVIFTLLSVSVGYLRVKKIHRWDF